MSDIATISPRRMVGTIVADVTIEEQGTDDLAITQHPVEQGAAITDHAYKQPSQVTLRLGWSNSSAGAQGNSDYVRNMYQKLLDLQAGRVPFDIVTGKRKYTSMLAASVAQTTDEASEYSLFVTLRCQQIIIVSTQTTQVPDASVQASPQDTAATQDAGTQQPTPLAEDGSTVDLNAAG